MSLVASIHRKVTDRPPSHAPFRRELLHYFESSSSGVELLQDGLAVMPFGEYLVETKLISRFQLFRALQLQDRHPGVKIGECVAALGFMQISEVERAYACFAHLPVVVAA